MPTPKLYTAREASRAGLAAPDAATLAASIQWCVHRLHVETSRWAVLRDTCARLRLAARRRNKPLVLNREARRFVLRVALRAHEANRGLFVRVMTGRI